MKNVGQNTLSTPITVAPNSAYVQVKIDHPPTFLERG